MPAFAWLVFCSFAGAFRKQRVRRSRRSRRPWRAESGFPRNDMQIPATLLPAFAESFGGRPRLFRAPGRVNLIGEHTDYTGGLVMPAAIHFSPGVAATLEAAGYRLRGANLLIHGEVPVGSGLSSSAAIEVATALALLKNSDLSVEPMQLALLCQRAENDFVGM